MSGEIQEVRGETGFTLVELLVSMLLMGLILAAAYGVYRVQARELKVQDYRLEAQEYVRTVVDLMVREIRNAGFDPKGVGCAGVFTADSQTLHFAYDADPSNSCSGSNQDITYQFSATGCPAGFGNITRNGEVITDCNVPTGTSNFSFTYYPRDSSTAYATPVAAGNLGTIQRVLITVKVQSKYSDPVFGGQLTASMTSNADLRNRVF
jgi:prepilin-type N-terminal cleavage/methylation domain-containing protein